MLFSLLKKIRFSVLSQVKEGVKIILLGTHDDNDYYIVTAGTPLESFDTASEILSLLSLLSDCFQTIAKVLFLSF